MQEQPKRKVRFAVYGTLKKGHHNSYLLKEAEYLGDSKTESSFTMHSMGGYPAVVPQGNTSIHLEIYETDDEDIIKNIYQLENYSGVRGASNNWYDTVDVETPYGLAEMFIFKTSPNTSIVESGNW